MNNRSDDTFLNMTEPDDIDETVSDDEADPSHNDGAASHNRFAVEIDGESITISNRPNRREAIKAALDRLPDEQFFVGGDMMTIVCTRIS